MFACFAALLWWSLLALRAHAALIAFPAVVRIVRARRVCTLVAWLCFLAAEREERPIAVLGAACASGDLGPPHQSSKSC